MLTEQQKRHRKLGIGGSDAAAIAGLSKWKTPLDIYNDKINDTVDEDKAVFYWGNALESVIIKKYEEETGNKVSTYDKAFIHKDTPYLLANVDGIVEDKKILIEVKTSRFFDGWGEDGTADIPQEYLLQIAHYLHVLDFDEAHIPVLIQGSDFRIYKYQRNKKLEENLLKIECDFWNNHVVAKTPPPISNLADAKNSFKVSSGEQIAVDDAIFQASNNLKTIKKEIKSLSTQADEYKLEIMKYMGDNSELVNFDGSLAITWKNITRGKFDVKQFKSDDPDLFDEYTYETTTRTFLIK